MDDEAIAACLSVSDDDNSREPVQLDFSLTSQDIEEGLSLPPDEFATFFATVGELYGYNYP